MTRKQWRRQQVMNRVCWQAYVQIQAAHRPPAEANYTQIMFGGGQGSRTILRRQPGTLLGWFYHDTGKPLGF